MTLDVKPEAVSQALGETHLRLLAVESGLRKLRDAFPDWARHCDESARAAYAPDPDAIRRADDEPKDSRVPHLEESLKAAIERAEKAEALAADYRARVNNQFAAIVELRKELSTLALDKEEQSEGVRKELAESFRAVKLLHSEVGKLTASLEHAEQRLRVLEPAIRAIASAATNVANT